MCIKLSPHYFVTWFCEHMINGISRAFPLTGFDVIIMTKIVIHLTSKEALIMLCSAVVKHAGSS